VLLKNNRVDIAGVCQLHFAKRLKKHGKHSRTHIHTVLTRNLPRVEQLFHTQLETLSPGMAPVLLG
jgi:hypothetical protein